jgi:hypothetical protein
LLEPFTMQANPADGTPLALGGMARVAEQKLATLDSEKIRSLMERGILSRLYSHLLSLDNFQRLLDRRASLGNRASSQA